MISNIIINVDNINYLSDYRKANVKAFLFALKDYCVGYNTYTVEEINDVDVSNKYVLINRILDNQAIDNLKDILLNFKNIKGIFYEDIGVYNLVKNLNLDMELIYNSVHFNTNVISVNYWLDRVNSVVISPDITEEEIRYIVNNAKSKVVLNLFLYNQVMYSRRLLLKNFSDEFSIPYKSMRTITDKATKIKFHAVENEYGTVMYSEKIYNAYKLLDLKNVKFFYINPLFIDHDRVMSYLNNNFEYLDNEDDGFLNKKTIYKLKGDK